MPFSKEQNRRIYITAIVLSLLLIFGSIYLHLRQKTHLGRMSFNLHDDRLKPTSGVETLDESENESKLIEDLSSDDGDEYYASYTEHDVAATYDYDEANESEIGNRTITDYYSDYGLSHQVEFSYWCRKCLCMTVNNCRSTFCKGMTCGLYRISRNYWIDAGKPTVAEETGSEETADEIARKMMLDEDERINLEYYKCINDLNCSEEVIINYSGRYKRDCNKDGFIDCQDHIALHLLGPNGCLTQNISSIHANRMNKCFREMFF